MQLSALVLTASVLGNAALVAVWCARPAPPPAAPVVARAAVATSTAASPGAPAGPAGRAGVAVPPLWSRLASDDLPTLVTRLRAAGFPPAVIRAVIEQRLNARFSPRIRALENPDPDAPFWKQPSPFLLPGDRRMEEINQLYRERARLARELLRDLPDSDVAATRRWQYGDLPAAKLDQLLRIEDDYAEMLSTLRAGTGGIMLPEDRAKIALLEREKKADLAALLTPAELADIELRTSATTRFLRNRLAGFASTEAEFRAIYAAQQAVNARFPGGTLEVQSADLATREAVGEAFNAQLRAGLGAERYADYLRATDSQYQQLLRLAQQNQIPTTTAQLAYDVRAATARESNRIADDSALAPAAKVAALKELAQQARGQISALLGSTAGDAYQRVAANWLGALERGNAFTVGGAPLAVVADSGTLTFSTSFKFRPVATPTR